MGATTKSRFSANGSFGGVTCGVRIVACAYHGKSAVRTLLHVCSGTMTRPVIPFDKAGATRLSESAYFGEDGIPIRGRGYVKHSGASGLVTVVWRNL